MIRELDPAADAEAIAAIYAPFVNDTDISFEMTPPSAAEMESRLAAITSIIPGFVWQEPDGSIAGYCYAHPWKGYAAYNPTFETTIYIAPAYARRGIGRALMERLIDSCCRHGAFSLIACITGGNEPSIALHRSLGFTRASFFRAVGYKAGRYLDVVDYQLMLIDPDRKS